MKRRWMVIKVLVTLICGIAAPAGASEMLDGCDLAASDCDANYWECPSDGDAGCDSACPVQGWMDSVSKSFKSCGLIQRSDQCFDDFISPMINFVHFEDPRTLTEIRPLFVNHYVPDAVGHGTSAGGDIQLLALQFRIALTDRLSLIGVKDGYIFNNSHNTFGTLLDDGWASVSGGLKYNLIRDPENGTLASVGATYEIPIGSRRALQYIGDGEFHLFATMGKRLFDGNMHYLSAFGYRVPVDGNLQTESVHWSNHIDVRITKRVYLLTEVAWWHWTDDAEGGTPLGIAGHDLFNLSASDVEGNDLVTQNVGLKVKPSRRTEIGIAYEFPLTDFEDVTDGRLQTEIILRY